MAPPRAAPNRKYTALYDAASACSSTPLTPQWAGGVLRALTSASWTDPTFLEELADSRLILSICQVSMSRVAAKPTKSWLLPLRSCTSRCVLTRLNPFTLRSCTRL